MSMTFRIWLLCSLFFPFVVQAQSVEDARSSICGKTVFFYENAHGNQVEYFAPDGFAYLWYPGNRVSVPSQWKIEPSLLGNAAQICFKYPNRSYNPVTKKFGGKWECRPFFLFESNMNDTKLSGDVFGLSLGSCSIPDDHIAPRRSALFMARWVLTEARNGRTTC